jgi:type I restriction enzyme S subunit
MKTETITNSQDHITQKGVTAARLRLFPAKSLLFVVRGMILAHTFPVAQTGAPVTVNQDVRVLVPHFPLLPAYLLRALQCEAMGILYAVKEATHGTLRVESDTLKTWPTPLPPLAEQLEIVRRVEALFKLADAIEKRVAAATARADKLTQAILAKTFRGELVPTEAELARREGRTYEPASALLERIQRERKLESRAAKGD